MRVYDDAEAIAFGTFHTTGDLFGIVDEATGAFGDASMLDYLNATLGS